MVNAAAKVLCSHLDIAQKGADKFRLGETFPRARRFEESAATCHAFVAARSNASPPHKIMVNAPSKYQPCKEQFVSLLAKRAFVVKIP
jgi:hypothetical protein